MAGRKNNRLNGEWTEEYRKEYNAKYYQENKKKISEDKKLYYQEHREERLEYNRRYREKHRNIKVYVKVEKPKKEKKPNELFEKVMQL